MGKKLISPYLEVINKQMNIINPYVLGGQLPTSGLINYWPLHGDKNDAIGGKHWTAYGTESYGTNRKSEANMAAVFTDTTTYFQFASDLDIGTVFTLSFWVYGEMQAPQLLNKSPQYCAYIAQTSAIIGFRATESKSITFNSVDNTWYHVILKRNGLAVNFMVNNSSLGTITDLTTNSNTLIRTLNKRYNNTDAVYALNGKMSDIRIYNRILDASEITQLYNE